MERLNMKADEKTKSSQAGKNMKKLQISEPVNVGATKPDEKRWEYF